MKFSLLENFLSRAVEDHRIHPTHISLYVALFYCWKQKCYKNPLDMRRDELMRLSKIIGRGTYQRCLRDLHESGYINYMPSFNRFVNAKIEMVFKNGIKENPGWKSGVFKTINH